MSLILDALRKSERIRQQSLTGRLGAGEVPPARTRLPVPWVTLLGLLLLVNAIVLGVLFFAPRSTPTAAPPAAPRPAPQPAVDYHPSVRPLAVEAGAPPPAAAPAVSSVITPAAPLVVGNVPDLPTFDSLSPEQRQNLPALHLDVHGYAANPQDRFVVINLKRYRIGDTLAEGPRVVDIVPTGAVLEFQGTTFLLPAS